MGKEAILPVKPWLAVPLSPFSLFTLSTGDERMSLAQLRTVADKCCQKHVENQPAITELLRWLANHPEENTEDVLWFLGTSLINDARHRQQQSRIGKSRRAHGEKGAEVPTKMSAEARRSVIRSTSQASLLMMITAGRVHLKDCTRTELLEDAQRQRQQGAGNLCRAVFMEKIAAGLKGNQKVSKRYKEPELRRLWEDAERDAKEQMGVAEEILAAV